MRFGLGQGLEETADAFGAGGGGGAGGIPGGSHELLLKLPHPRVVHTHYYIVPH